MAACGLPASARWNWVQGGLVKDGHSSFSKQAAKLIDQWNQKLMPWAPN